MAEMLRGCPPDLRCESCKKPCRAVNEHGDCVKCASGQPFDHAEPRDLSPATDFLKGLLRTLLEDLKRVGFTQDAAHQLAEGLLVQTMQVDQQVQEGTRTAAEAQEHAQALYDGAREARPTTTAQAGTDGPIISAGLVGRLGVGWV